MVFPMYGANLVEERAQTGDFLTGVLVVSVLDVPHQVSQSFCLPGVLFLHGTRRLRSHLQGIQYLIRVQIRSAASFIERLVAAAAIIDAQLFKHSRGSRVFQGQLPYGLFGSNTHRILLRAGYMLPTTLDDLTLPERREAADDFCHTHPRSA